MIDKSTNIIKAYHREKHQQQHEADEVHPPFRFGGYAFPPADALDENEDQPAAIQRRQWQQVHYAEAYAEKSGERE
jgi:hypothetical protein